MEALARVEVLDSDSGLLVVLGVENHLVHLEVEFESSEESCLEEEKACRLADSEVERQLVGKEGMACRGRQEEAEGPRAFQKVGEACLYMSERDKVSRRTSHTWQRSGKWRWKASSPSCRLQHGICLTGICIRGCDGVNHRLRLLMTNL